MYLLCSFCAGSLGFSLCLKTGGEAIAAAGVPRQGAAGSRSVSRPCSGSTEPLYNRKLQFLQPVLGSERKLASGEGTHLLLVRLAGTQGTTSGKDNVVGSPGAALAICRAGGAGQVQKLLAAGKSTLSINPNHNQPSIAGGRRGVGPGFSSRVNRCGPGACWFPPTLPSEPPWEKKNQISLPKLRNGKPS